MALVKSSCRIHVNLAYHMKWTVCVAYVANRSCGRGAYPVGPTML